MAELQSLHQEMRTKLPGKYDSGIDEKANMLWVKTLDRSDSSPPWSPPDVSRTSPLCNGSVTRMRADAHGSFFALLPIEHMFDRLDFLWKTLVNPSPIS
jgi:hypothetical protein